ncbi:MAG: HEPN domain-containing protein [Pseudomonadota bacterium]
MLNLAELWLQYANDDLRSAKVLLQEGIHNMVCFHSQQAVENLFKSLIAAYHKEIPRTHNLVRLRKISEDLIGKEIEICEDALLFVDFLFILPFLYRFILPTSYISSS